MSDYWQNQIDELNKKKKKKSTTSNSSTKKTTSTSSNDYWGNQIAELQKSKSKSNDIAPVTKVTPTVTAKPTVTTAPTGSKSNTNKSLFDDGYDFGDITRTILGLKDNKKQEKSSFDQTLMKKYSTMSLSEIEKEYARIEKEEKLFKEKNGGKFMNYLSLYGPDAGRAISGQPTISAPTKAQSEIDKLNELAKEKNRSNIDKINDFTREKEIINIYRKQRATEEYLGGLSKEQIKLLDDISKADDLEKAKPLVLAMQGDNADMAGLVYHQQTKGDMDASDDAFTTLSKQLKKKFPDKGNDEIHELINNMVELRKNQVNAEEKERLDAQAKELSTEHPVSAFALSRAANLIGGMTALPELAFQWDNEYGLDTNAPGFLPTHTSNAVDEQIQLDHDWEVGGVDGFDLFYKVGTGVVDNVGRLALSGGNTTMAGALMFTQGTTQSIIAGKEKGYSDSKALTLGLLDGTFEAISEKVSLDLILKSDGTVLKTLAKSFAAEGGEEVTSNWLNRIADEIANGKHSELSKLYDAYIRKGYTESQALAEVVCSVIGEDFESFVVAGLSGVVLGGGVSVAEKVSNRNSIELTDNEQKVVDKVVEDRIAEEKANGNTVDKKKEKEIRKEVLQSVAKGYANADTIESVLDSERYEAYKKAVEEDTAQKSKLTEEIEKYQQEYDALYGMTWDKKTDVHRDRQDKLGKMLEKLKSDLDALTNDTKISDMKGELIANVSNLVKGSRLEATYRGNFESYKPDFSKYKGTKHEDAARKTIENAVKSGANNTNAVRDLVDMNAKISAETGVVFEYKTPEEIKQDFIDLQTEKIKKLESIPESERTDAQRETLADLKKALEEVQSGKKKVNGNFSKGVITLNIKAENPLRVVTGHEILHKLVEGKSLDSYKGLKESLKSFIGAEEYENRLDERKSTYEGFETDPEEELIADLVGEYIFTDYEYIKHLSINNRNVFQKIYDEIKYLCKIATAGSKEARELEKVRKNFEKVYKESANAKASAKKADTGVKHSLTTEQETYFNDSKVRDENGNLKVMYHGTSKGGHTWFDTYGSNYGLFGTGSYFTDNKEVADSYTKKGRGENPQVYEVYLNITNPLDMDAQANPEEWKKAFDFDDIDLPESGTNEQFFRAVEEYYYEEMMPKWEVAEIIRETIESGMGYDGITHIGGGRFNKKDETRHRVYIAFEPEQIKNIDNIAPTKDADIRYSLTETDNKYLDAVNRGDIETAQRMVDEVAKKNGYETDAYHGTNQGDFTTFDWDKTQRADGGFFGRGHYFTKSKNMAELYGKRIIEGKLKLGKTFVWSDEVNSYKGKKAPDLLSRNIVSRINMAQIFPDLFANKTMSYWEYDSQKGENVEKTIRWGELDRIVNELTKELTLREYADGTYRWHTEGRFWEVPVGDSYLSAEEANEGKVFAAINSLNEKYNGLLSSMTFDDQTTYTQQYGTEITESLKNKGYQSAMDTPDGGEIVVFDSSQIKSADTITYDDKGNVIPLSERFKAEDNDIRYSLTEDAEGNKLTEKQSEYFKDSKAVDRNGNLLKVYHTTKNDFTVFDKSRKGEATEDANTYLGFFFTDDAEYMQNFPEFENGKTESYYLDMKNPIDMTDISREAFVDIVEVMGGDVGDALILYDEELEAAHDRAKLRGDNNVSLQLGHLLDELTGEFYYNDFITELKPHYDELMSKGYDGVINYMDELFGVKEYIVLDSNQAKLTSNKNPTADADVRYSISTEKMPFPKAKKTTTPTNANLLKDSFTVRDIRSKTMLENNYTQDDVDQINDFMDNLATFMEKAGVTYKFIGLEDVNNAKVKIVYDRDGTPMRVTMSAMVKNGDYPVNFDFTSICKKRQSMSMVIQELARRKNGDGIRALDEISLDANALWTINEELRKAGLETACLGCFVESRRYNIQNFADKATTMWNNIVDEIRQEQGKTEPVENFNFAEGIDLESVDYSKIDEIFKAYNEVEGRTNPEKRMRALIKSGGDIYQRYLQPSDLMTPEGIEGLKSLSTTKNDFYGIIKGVYGTAAPKEVMGFSPYNSEVALLPDTIGKRKTAEYIASIGGVRMQSFSDFIVSNVYDYMQMVADLSAKHLPAHAYTKEIAFAKIFGMTGIKINMSVMFDIDASLPNEYAGLQFIPDANGDEVYEGVRGRFEYLVGDQKRSDEMLAETGERSYVQSIGFDEAVELQNTEGYSGNVGIIGVGFSDKHIRKMLNDNNIRYVIPYHSSNLPTVIKGVTNIAKARDYTNYQNTRTESGDSLVGLGGFDIYKDVGETKSPKQTAQNYLDYCKSNNYTPVFDMFKGEENYYKLLFDFDPYDTITGEYSPQTEVRNIYKGYNAAEGLTSTAEIEKLIDDEMKTQNEANRQRNAALPGVVDSVLEQLGASDDKIGFSLSTEGQTTQPFKSFDVRGDDFFVKGRTEDIAPIQPTVSETEQVEDIAPTKQYEAIEPRPDVLEGEEAQWAKNKMARADKVNTEQPSVTNSPQSIGENVISAPLKGATEVMNRKDNTFRTFVRNFVSKGNEIETLALKTGNRAVEDKYKMWRDRSEAKAQYFMEKGNGSVKSLKSIVERANKAGLYNDFDRYLKHKHNVDRMRYDLPVFGYDTTAAMSQQIASDLEAKHPEFKEWANDTYAINNHLKQMMVDAGIITQETADLWAKKYPYYVPIERLSDDNIKLGGKGVGISAPIKRATGGSSESESILKAMAHRTEQVFKAVSKNAFGIELKNTIGAVSNIKGMNTDDVLDGLDAMDERLLQAASEGNAPTFTVFENGKRLTFDISNEMYETLKPTSEAMSKEHKILSKPTAWHKKVLTEYNLFFTARNFPKDAQEVILNSHHAAKTYANMPKAVAELLKGKGKYLTEYWENGGKSNTYFDSRKNKFETDSTFKKVVGLVPNGISKINDFVEAIPRLAEYMASRKQGATIEAAMTDAARVTTDFSDGGDITKFFNRNGATFLNASVQGAAQQVRNIRQAKAEGFKGVVKLVGKYALSGLPVLLFNQLMWDDDEEYEELSEYVKDNYYIVAKYGDGQFVRIPKGRTASVIQEFFEQFGNMITGEETDWKNVAKMAISNVAPNSPIDNNILAPIIQASKGKTWYGEDLVPSRLQNEPLPEQYDESIDTISKWLGEKFNDSPYKINYVLNQYSGFIGDIVLPAFTPEAERGDSSAIGNIIAPLKDQFVVDKVMDNKNPSDFFSLGDELEVNANADNATAEDKLKHKYIKDINFEISDLYKQKREIQNSNLSDELKFKQVRDLQAQINEMSKNALDTYENVKIDGSYANVGGRHFRLNDEGEWQKITDEQLEKQNDAIGILGVTPGQYWNNKDEYDMKAFYPEKYAVLQEEGISVEEYKEKYEKWIHLPNDDFSWAANNPEKYTFSKAITDDVMAYREITSGLYEIRADKDSNGKSISGTAKKKKQEYIWNLDIDDGAKYILFKNEYPSFDDKNREIVEYLDNRDDISYDEMMTILEELKFKVDRDTGYISW